MGDVLALVRLAINRTTCSAVHRETPSECRVLLQDLLSMERILTGTNSMMCEIECSPPENPAMEQLRAALRRVQNDLDLVAKFPSGSNQLVAREHVHEARVAKVSTNTVRMLETCTMCSNIL